METITNEEFTELMEVYIGYMTDDDVFVSYYHEMLDIDETEPLVPKAIELLGIGRIIELNKAKDAILLAMDNITTKQSI